MGTSSFSPLDFSNDYHKVGNVVKQSNLVLITLISEERKQTKHVVNSFDLWYQIWDISVEALVRYANISQTCSQHEIHLITVLQQSIPLFEESERSEFIGIIEKVGYLNALHTLTNQYKSIDKFISTKLSILVHTIENVI